MDENVIREYAKEEWNKIAPTFGTNPYYTNGFIAGFIRALANVSENESNCNLTHVSGSYSDEDVRNIILEMNNAAMYGHSHKLTRFELQAELQKVKDKWKVAK